MDEVQHASNLTRFVFQAIRGIIKVTLSHRPWLMDAVWFALVEEWRNDRAWDTFASKHQIPYPQILTRHLMSAHARARH